MNEMQVIQFEIDDVARLRSLKYTKDELENLHDLYIKGHEEELSQESEWWLKVVIPNSEVGNGLINFLSQAERLLRKLGVRKKYAIMKIEATAESGCKVYVYSN